MPFDARAAGEPILDMFGATASVRVDADAWVDYLHLDMWNSRPPPTR
jgi:hypothetical protein